jgi:hypothetical protein
MLIENTQPNVHKVGPIYILTGVNEVDSKEWASVLKSGYERAITALVKDGVFKITPDEDAKLTVATIESTYDVHLLDKWNESAKGPLKGAIRKQREKILGTDKAG